MARIRSPIRSLRRPRLTLELPASDARTESSATAMLQKMREQARGVFGWIVIGSIIMVLAIFGFGALNFFVTSEPAVAKVGDVEIKQSEVLTQMDRQRRQILASMGQRADPSLIDEDALRKRVMSGLIERTLLLEGAREAGMGVPEGEIDKQIVSMQEFQVDGRFDKDRYQLVLSSAGMTPVGFRKALGQDMVVNQLSTGLGDSAFVTPAELSEMAALTRQSRDAAWMTFDPEDYKAKVQVSDDEVRAFYDAHQDRYHAPEQVTLNYLELDRDALASAVEVSDAELQEAYQAEVSAFEGQEERRASHILLAVNKDRTQEQAIALAKKLAERARNGEDFAKLAKEYSDDPGSAAQGGNLGMMTRSNGFSPAFDKALFALSPGEISDPVVTKFGVHVIELQGISTSSPPSFERLKPTLASRIRQRKAQDKFDEERATLETVAYEAPDLKEPSQRLGLEIRTSAPLTREGGKGLFAVQSVIDAAFSPDVLDSGYNSSVLEPKDGVLLVVRVADHQPEHLRDFAEVQQDVRTDLVAERALSLAQDAAEQAFTDLQGDASATSVAATSGHDWTVKQGLLRTDSDAPQKVVNEAFELPVPPTGGRSVGRTETGSGALAVVTVTAVRPGDLAALTEVERKQLEQLVRRRVGGNDFQAYRDLLRQEIGVSERAAGAASDS